MKGVYINDTLTIAEQRLRETLAKPDISAVDAATIKLQIALLRPFDEWMEEMRVSSIEPKEIAVAAVNVMGVLTINLVAMYGDEYQDFARGELKKMLCQAIDHYATPNSIEIFVRMTNPDGATH